MTASIEWESFLNRSPDWAHRTTKLALEVVGPGENRAALDIGSGNGRDALLMAEAGFLITAVDISGAVPELGHPKISQFRADIVDFPLERYALINASLVLSFIARERFDAFWPRLLDALILDGVVAGHLSGTRDWKVEAGQAWGSDAKEAELLLSGLTIVSINENELDGPNISGVLAHKHNFEFVARGT